MHRKLLYLIVLMFLSIWASAQTTTINDTANSEIPTIALEEINSTTDDQGTSSQSVSGLLGASYDPFLHAAANTFWPYHFRARGADLSQQQVQINGLPMSDLERGETYFGQWGGLNDVFRSRTHTFGLFPSEYSYGGTLGSIYFDATAANQSKQTRISYSLSDRSYHNRLMLTHSTGLMKNGWAFSFSVSKRWTNDGNYMMPGTFYDAYSYYAAASKAIGKHTFNFTTFAAPTRRGKESPTTQEVYDLAGSNFYNRNWGYQNGVKRDANVADVFQPLFMFNHEYKVSEKTRWNTAIGYQFGKNKNSRLDWYNGSDPYPDYYGYLPSYYLNSVPPNPAAASQVQSYILNNPNSLQIDWNRLYNVNYLNTATVHNVDGIAGRDVTGKESLYVLKNDVADMKKWMFNTNIEHTINDHLTVDGGLTYVTEYTEKYAQVADLLGGDFFVNYNQFAEREYVGNTTYGQYDLNDPNRIVKVGDKYEYDYIERFNKGQGWGQIVGKYDKVDLFAAANIGFSSFSREGLYRNGLFPDASYGKSPTQSFFTYGIKAGATYKMDGRNYFFLNAAYGADAPTFDNTYISPRTRDFTVDNPTVQKNQNVEAGYFLKSPNVTARISGYVSDVMDASDIKHFYNDDPQYKTFVNYVMQNINMHFIGTEFAVDAKVAQSFNITAVASIGQATYSNRPTVSVSLDNDTTRAVTQRKVYIQNYYLPVGPQSAYTLGFRYSTKNHWTATINFNYLDRNYVEINPDRHTPDAVDMIPANSPLWHEILDQEKLPSIFTIDVFASKSIQLSKYNSSISKNTSLYLNAGINNLLNNTNIITGGFEQLRYDFTDNNPAKFPNKYFYGFGLNFFVNVSLKF